MESRNHLKNGAVSKSLTSRTLKPQPMESKFFTFIKPYIAFIDDGHFFRKPFSWLYIVMAILSLLIPIVMLYRAVDGGVLDLPGKVVLVFVLFWIILAFAGWVGFQQWWDRRTKVGITSIEGDDFTATPAFSHFIQTLGEWIGTWLGLVGFGYALLSTIFLGNSGGYLTMQLGVPYLSSGPMAIITMPIYGFLIVVFSRFLSEQIRALASIANNTKK